ncbi:hypothetical protein HGRIS_000276 [Hohenbuehelia grisea]|uniref:FAD dependent oxidoreductase domain-containing protein n=2 Tax=Hohenbuehelia grisea TaxID=104357 RepID=A0ABR3JSK0_9AGAR
MRCDYDQGAHHVSTDRGDSRMFKFEKDTFDIMWDLSKPGGEAEHCFMRVRQEEYYDAELAKPNPLEDMPDFQYLSNDSVGNAVSGVTFSTVTIDTPIYLNYLLSRFLARGGTIIRASVQHINQVLEGGPQAFLPGRRPVYSTNDKATVDALVICTGLATRTLGGVEDKAMYPIRGQTVLIRAPWIKYGRSGYTASEDLSATGKAPWSYIIPRRSGDVILGGTRDKDDWFPLPRPDTTTKILTRTLALCPELTPPETRSNGRQPTVDDLRSIIVEEGCGLRPAREGGVRVEVEYVSAGANSTAKVPIVYNYGHGGAGFQSSWGTAAEALRLLGMALQDA